MWVQWLIVCMCDPWAQGVWLTITFVCVFLLQGLNTIWIGPPGTLIPFGSRRQLRCCMNVIYFQRGEIQIEMRQRPLTEAESEILNENGINGKEGYSVLTWEERKFIVLIRFFVLLVAHNSDKSHSSIKHFRCWLYWLSSLNVHLLFIVFNVHFLHYLTEN